MDLYKFDLEALLHVCMHQIKTCSDISRQVYFPMLPGHTHVHPSQNLVLVIRSLQMMLLRTEHVALLHLWCMKAVHLIRTGEGLAFACVLDAHMCTQPALSHLKPTGGVV